MSDWNSITAEREGSCLDSHFSLEFKDENRLIQYLHESYNLIELNSICRALNLDKDDVLNKNWLKRANCEALVDIVRQRELYDELFRLLQIPQLSRKRFGHVFPELKTHVVDAQEESNMVSKVYDAHNQLMGVTLSDWVAMSKEKTVLILGKDSPDVNFQRLKQIARFFKEAGYEPILIKEQPEIETLTNEEKMLAYAAISRFVVIEKSEAAGQIDEAKMCNFNRIPAIWLQRRGEGDTWMQGDYEVDFKFIKIFQYDEDRERDVFQAGVSWVEQFLRSKAQYLNQHYPWRRNELR